VKNNVKCCKCGREVFSVPETYKGDKKFICCRECRSKNWKTKQAEYQKYQRHLLDTISSFDEPEMIVPIIKLMNEKKIPLQPPHGTMKTLLWVAVELKKRRIFDYFLEQENNPNVLEMSLYSAVRITEKRANWTQQNRWFQQYCLTKLIIRGAPYHKILNTRNRRPNLIKGVLMYINRKINEETDAFLGPILKENGLVKIVQEYLYYS